MLVLMKRKEEDIIEKVNQLEKKLAVAQDEAEKFNEELEYQNYTRIKRTDPASFEKIQKLQRDIAIRNNNIKDIKNEIQTLWNDNPSAHVLYLIRALIKQEKQVEIEKTPFYGKKNERSIKREEDEFNQLEKKIHEIVRDRKVNLPRLIIKHRDEEPWESAQSDWMRRNIPRGSDIELLKKDEDIPVSDQKITPQKPSWIENLMASGKQKLRQLVGLDKTSLFVLRQEILQEFKDNGLIRDFNTANNSCKIISASNKELLFNNKDKKFYSNDFSQETYELAAKISHANGAGFDMKELVKQANESRAPNDLKNEYLYKAYAAGRKLEGFKFANLPPDIEKKLDERFKEEEQFKLTSQGFQR